MIHLAFSNVTPVKVLHFYVIGVPVSDTAAADGGDGASALALLERQSAVTIAEVMTAVATVFVLTTVIELANAGESYSPYQDKD